MTIKNKNARVFSILAFAFSFAYLLSFLFEGQVLYSLLSGLEVQTSTYILAPITGHFMGLISCGFLMRSNWTAKHIMLGAILICLISTTVFFFASSFLWLMGLIIASFASGCALAGWGYFLKAFTPKNERIKTCADVLILSNIFMIIINVVAINSSPFMGLGFAIVFLIIGAIFTWRLPNDQVTVDVYHKLEEPVGDLKKPMMLLFLFITIITINSGLMYQVVNPAFGHLTTLTNWYWAVPYILTLLVMRNYPQKAKNQFFYMWES